MRGDPGGSSWPPHLPGSAATAFTGFTADTVRFLTELSANNDVARFEANRRRNADALPEPARASASAHAAASA